MNVVKREEFCGRRKHEMHLSDIPMGTVFRARLGNIVNDLHVWIKIEDIDNVNVEKAVCIGEPNNYTKVGGCLYNKGNIVYDYEKLNATIVID